MDYFHFIINGAGDGDDDGDDNGDDVAPIHLNFDDVVNVRVVGEQHSNRLNPITLDDLDDLVEACESCSICLEHFEHFEQTRTTGDVCKLQCTHHYHINCLNKWLRSRSNNTCPLCRTVI